MAVNNNFYAVVNELSTRASNGTITGIVDYDSFIDKGKAYADIQNTDLRNDFIKALMNKVQKTILDTPSYRGSFTSMYAGKLNYGVLEIIMGDFYTTTPSVFDGDTLTEGQTYTDQFKVENLPKATARYYTDYDSYMFDITIRDTDIQGAWSDPAKMDGFFRKVFLDVSNSNEFHKEVSRLAVVADIIKEVSGTTAEEADEDAASMNYNLLAIYNEKKGTELTADNCLYNNDFVSWSVGVIRDVSMLLQKPSDLFNVLGEITTFSPAEYQNLKINAIYDKAIRRSLVDAYNPEYGMITIDHEIVPYWQNIKDRLRVTTNSEAGTTYSPKVLAILMDNRSCGEMQNLESVESTRNAKRKYTNYHYAFSYMYWSNLNANTVIFTIG